MERNYKLSLHDLKQMSDKKLAMLLQQAVYDQQRDVRENQLLYYRPVSPSAKQVHFLPQQVITVGIGGGNGCLPLDAPVLMADGSWKQLGAIKKGDMVMAASPVTGEAEPAPVTTVWRSGVKPVYKITFSDGGAFRATAEHMVPMYLGSGRLTSKGNPKTPEKRRLGDYIEPINRRGAANPSKRISCVSPSNIRGVDHTRRICRSAVLVGEMEVGDIEVGHSSHCYITSDYVIVSNSSKTETSLVELVMCATGIFPQWLIDEAGMAYLKAKSRGPMNCRIIVKSLKNQLESIMLRKLKWWEWTGLLPVGGEKGHWGWIPRTSLIDGSWDKSWSAGKTTLSFYHKDPLTDEVDGVSTIQFMSSDQEALAMAGNDLQFALLDEPSTLAIWRETQARVMRGQGRIFLAMTWPDDPSIPVDWIFDEIYDKADTSESVVWLELSTFDNPHLDQDAVQNMAGSISSDLRKVRYEGKPMRFSNLIHPQFTDVSSAWCFECGAETSILPSDPPVCATCRGMEVTRYCHVKDFQPNPRWPTVFLLDPHPRKPHMWSWVQVDPNNDLWQIAEGALAQEPADVAEMVLHAEATMGIHVAQRLIDPNMGRTPCGKKRDITWQDEFTEAGLYCELADDSGVGRQTINERLKPDRDTYAPRLHIAECCQQTIFQMKRFAWDEHRLNAEKDLKQVPKPKHDDYPTLLKYLVNSRPNYRVLVPDGGGVIRTRIHRRNVR